MRIKVVGNSVCARGLRGMLEREGFALVDTFPQFTIELFDAPQATCPILDSVDSELERLVLVAIAELTPSGEVLVRRAGGNQQETVMRIYVPATNEAEHFAVQRGIVRALHRLKQANVPGDPPPPTGWQAWLGRTRS